MGGGGHKLLSDFADVNHNHDTAYLGINSTAADSDKLDGKHATDFATSTHNHNDTYLGIDDKASDSDKLDGHEASYYAPASVLGDINTILESI